MLRDKSTALLNFQKVLDCFIISISWLLSYVVRFYYLPGAQKGLEWDFIKVAPILVVITSYFFHKNTLYHSQRFDSKNREVYALVKSLGLGLAYFVIMLYFFWPERISRIALIYYFVIVSILSVVCRFSIRNLLRYFRKRGRNLRHVVLVGDGSQLGEYLEETRRLKDAGIRVIGWIGSEGLSKKYNILELEEDFKKIKDEKNPDSWIIGVSSSHAHKLHDYLKNCYNDIVPVQLIPELSFNYIGHKILYFGDIPLINFNRPHFSSLDYLYKRSFDILFSLLAILILAPAYILIGLLVKLTSRGPIFYSQERLGLDGKPFMMLKFRSMRIDAEEKSGAVWCIEDDPRRTKFGTFLRSSSLDELPQFFNVLLGQMSLVGPRPERAIFVEKFRNEIPSYMLRLKVKAGITGLAQVEGWRGNTDLGKRIECDIEYIKKWTLFLDIKILFLTIWKGLFNKNAY